MGSSRCAFAFSTRRTTGEPLSGSSMTPSTFTSTGPAAAAAEQSPASQTSARKEHRMASRLYHKPALKGGAPSAEIIRRTVMGAGRQRPSRRALVLAGGGIVGGLYEVGALLALDSVCEGFSTCDFDLYVGSSAGAFIAALLANRVSADRLREALDADQRTLPRLSASRFMTLPWRSYLDTAPRLAAALRRLVGDLWAHWDEAFVLDTATSLLRALPCGIFSLEIGRASCRERV